MMTNSETGSTAEKKNILQEVKYIPTGSEKDEPFQPEDEIKRSDTLFLQFTVMTALLIFMVGGTTIVWTSPAIVKMKSNDSSINPLGRPIQTYEISKFMGIVGILALGGSLVLPKLADVMGRKRSLWIMAFFMFVGIVGLGLSRSVNVMIICSTIIALFFGGAMGILPMYLTEICEDHNRTKYGCLMSAFIPIGQLYTYLIGPVFSYTVFTILTAVPMIPFLVMFFFAPESPVYSLEHGNKEECSRALKKLRSNKTETELDNDLRKISKALETTNKTEGNSVGKLFGTKEGRVGMLLSLLPLFVQYFSGVPVLMMLMAPIFNNSGSFISGSTIGVCVGVVKIILFTTTSLIVERFGRRPLLLISAGGAALPVSLLGLYFYLKQMNSPFVYQYPWIPLVCVLTFVSFYSIGLGPIPITVMGEMFSADTRSTGCAIVTTISSMALTIYVSAYPILAELVGTHWCMWMFGTCCFGGALLIYFLLPETKGKSVVEIQEILKNY
ncbi:trehalose transporter 1-like protein [Diabrotica undecimpunctata]|uniref:trehalose transporter 1-like protein n=1 Tax=Diabrotica undecimpunctata TaxID=50387 RepID=UPI003B63F7E8